MRDAPRGWLSRRDFLVMLGASPAIAALPVNRSAAAAGAAAEISIGYAAITWGGNDVQAIEDVAAVGFKAIQLRASAVERWGNAPAGLKALLQQHHLKMPVLSSGNLRLDPAYEAEDLAKHAKNARFVHDAGGTYLQVIDEPPKGRTLDAADFKRMGALLTELGKRTADAGVPLVYHLHMGSMSERPEGTAAIMDASDPKYVRLLFDVAHYQQGGGDPVKGITRYRDRIAVVHLKDVRPVTVAAGASGRPYQFVELGRGRVDLKGVVAALNRIQFRGWAIVELDSVPDQGRTAKECAAINRDYLQRELQLAL